MAFLTIEPAAALSPSRLERAIEHGPPEVAVEVSHEQMLAAAGFTEIEAVDVSVEFSRTQQAWIDTWHTHEDALLRALGPEVLNERTADRRAMRGAIDEDLLRRTLYSARTPQHDPDART